MTRYVRAMASHSAQAAPGGRLESRRHPRRREGVEDLQWRRQLEEVQSSMPVFSLGGCTRRRLVSRLVDGGPAVLWEGRGADGAGVRFRGAPGMGLWPPRPKRRVVPGLEHARRRRKLDGAARAKAVHDVAGRRGRRPRRRRRARAAADGRGANGGGAAARSVAAANVDDSPASTSASRRIARAAASGSGSAPRQPRLVAVASYESQHAGELSVRVGRSLDVIQVAKGWVAVVDDAGGAGWVPDAVVGGQAEVLARLGGAKLPRTLRPKSRGSPVGSPVRAARALDRLGHVSPQINRRSASTTNLPRINDDEAAAQHVVEGAKFEIESAKHVQSNYDSEDDLDAASHELLDRGDRDARDALLARNELEAMQHENAALRKRVEELEACTLTPRRRLREVASNTTADVVAMKKERDECRDQLDCALCMERPRSVAFFPCTHLCACAECAAQCSECPQCRRAVQSKLQVIIS